MGRLNLFKRSTGNSYCTTTVVNSVLSMRNPSGKRTSHDYSNRLKLFIVIGLYQYSERRT